MFWSKSENQGTTKKTNNQTIFCALEPGLQALKVNCLEGQKDGEKGREGPGAELPLLDRPDVQPPKFVEVQTVACVEVQTIAIPNTFSPKEETHFWFTA